MSSVDDLVEAYRQADLRLRRLLLGDGMYVAGVVKGEEGRSHVTRELGRMRDAFSALRELEETRAGEAKARVADLEETLQERVASSRSGRAKSTSRDEVGDT